MPTFDQNAQVLALKIRNFWNNPVAADWVRYWVQTHYDETGPSTAFLQAAGKFQSTGLGIDPNTLSNENLQIANRAVALANVAGRIAELYRQYWDIIHKPAAPPAVVVAAPPPPATGGNALAPEAVHPAPAETTPPIHETPDPGQKIPNTPTEPTVSNITALNTWWTTRAPYWFNLTSGAAKAGDFTKVSQHRSAMITELATIGITRSKLEEFLTKFDRAIAGIETPPAEPEPPANYPDPEHVPGPQPPPTPEVAGDPPGESPPTAPPTETQTVWVNGLEGYVTLDMLNAAGQGNRIMQYRVISELKAAGKITAALDLAKAWGQDFGLLRDSKIGVEAVAVDTRYVPVEGPAGGVTEAPATSPVKAILSVLGLLAFGKTI